jgi:hypothetical protein
LSGKLTPQQEGTEFEKRFSDKYNGTRQPRSGAGIYHKLDVRDSQFLWSLKWTGDNKSFRFLASDFKEVNDEVYGPGGIGIEYTPGLAVELKGEVYAILKMDDLVGMLEQDVKVFAADPATEKRAKSKVPSLLRPDSE